MHVRAEHPRRSALVTPGRLRLFSDRAPERMRTAERCRLSASSLKARDGSRNRGFVDSLAPMCRLGSNGINACTRRVRHIDVASTRLRASVDQTEARCASLKGGPQRSVARLSSGAKCRTTKPVRNRDGASGGNYTRRPDLSSGSDHCLCGTAGARSVWVTLTRAVSGVSCERRSNDTNGTSLSESLYIAWLYVDFRAGRMLEYINEHYFNKPKLTCFIEKYNIEHIYIYFYFAAWQEL
jgi:hypothetical protein